MSLRDIIPRAFGGLRLLLWTVFICLVFSLQINSSLRPHERSPCSSGASILADEASPASVAASLLLPPRSPYPSDTLYHNMLSLITQPSRNLPSVLSLHHPCISFLGLP